MYRYLQFKSNSIAKILCELSYYLSLAWVNYVFYLSPQERKNDKHS